MAAISPQDLGSRVNASPTTPSRWFPAIPAHLQTFVDECIRKAKAGESLTNWLPEEIMKDSSCPNCVLAVCYNVSWKTRNLLDNLPQTLLNQAEFLLTLIRAEETSEQLPKIGGMVTPWLMSKKFPICYNNKFILGILKAQKKIYPGNLISTLAKKRDKDSDFNALVNDPSFIRDAVRITEHAVRFASHDLRINRDFLIGLAAECPSILDHVSHDFSRSIAFINAVNEQRNKIGLRAIVVRPPAQDPYMSFNIGPPPMYALPELCYTDCQKAPGF